MKARATINKVTAMVFGIGLGVVWLSGPSARATSLTVSNYSFESEAVGVDGGTSPTVPGWTLAGSGLVFDPQNPQYSGATAGALPVPGDANQVGVLYGGVSSFSQTLTGVPLQPANIYTLTVAVGHRGDGGTDGGANNFSIELYAGATLLASQAGNNFTFAPAFGFADATVTYTNTLIGFPAGDLRIVLNNLDTGGPQRNFDNVRLDVIPEPATLGLGLVGGLLV